MIPKTERDTDTLKQALTRQRQKVYHECLRQKSHERKTVHKCLWQRKKEQTTNACGKERANHKCWWQTKNGFPNQSSKQLTPNERTQQLKSPQNPKRLPTCKHKVEKTPPNHNSLIDYCLQQRSGRLVIRLRAQSKNNCANDKQMESQTNHY